MPVTDNFSELHYTPPDGNSIAAHLLVALEDAEPNGLLAYDIGKVIDVSGAAAGAYLRDLRAKGWVYKEKVTPGSYIVYWHISHAGKLYLNRGCERCTWTSVIVPGPGGGDGSREEETS